MKKVRIALSVILALIMACSVISFTGCACKHEWANGVCAKCEAVCEHTFTEGVCTNCGYEDDNYLTTNEFCLQQVTLIGEYGATPDKFQLSFLQSENTDGVNAYGMCYSTASPKEVQAYLKSLTREQIDALEEESYVYIITNLGWADGGANTYRSRQRDLISGKMMTEPGTYTFFCFTLGNSGMLGISKADRTVYRNAYASDLDFVKTGNELNLTYVGYDDDNISANILFYSTTNMVDVNMRVAMLSANEINTLSTAQKAVKTENAVAGNAQIDLSVQLDIHGKSYDDTKSYYVYIASLNNDGKVIGITKSNRIVTPTILPTPLTSIGLGEGTGLIFPNGGACTTTNLAKSVLTQIKAQIGGKPRVAIISAASGTESDNYTGFETQSTMFKQVGMQAVYIPLNIENYTIIGNDDYFAALIASCHGVHFLGGDQSKISRCIYNNDGTLNKCGAAIYNIVKNGGFSTGTSAGANIMSNPTYLNGTSTSTINANRTENVDIGNCLGGAPNTSVAVATQGLNWGSEAVGAKVLFDSHFDARSRLGRMLVALRDNEVKIGIGLDEGTGIAIRNGVGTVYGPNGVFILDASNANYGTGESFTCNGVKLYYLTEGDTINFATMKVSTQKSLVIESADSDWNTQDVFHPDGYRTTKAAVTFAFSGKQAESYGIYEQTIKLTFTRTDETKVYESSTDKFTLSGLNQYGKCTIIALDLSIGGGE